MEQNLYEKRKNVHLQRKPQTKTNLTSHINDSNLGTLYKARHKSEEEIITIVKHYRYGFKHFFIR